VRYVWKNEPPGPYASPASSEENVPVKIGTAGPTRLVTRFVAGSRTAARAQMPFDAVPAFPTTKSRLPFGENAIPPSRPGMPRVLPRQSESTENPG